MTFFIRILLCITFLVQPNGQGSVTSSFTYDANGQVTNYLWDEASANGDVAVETDVSHTPQARYILGNGQLVAQERSGATSFYLQDGQQNVQGLADTTGNQTDTYLYDAYGNLQNRTGTTANPYQYTGQQVDSITGLYYLRARSYDPSTGRFLTQDPSTKNIADPVQINRYTYSGDNPTNISDPSGKLFSVDFGTVLQQTATFALRSAGYLGQRFVEGFISGGLGYIFGVGVFVSFQIEQAKEAARAQNQPFDTTTESDLAQSFWSSDFNLADFLYSGFAGGISSDIALLGKFSSVLKLPPGDVFAPVVSLVETAFPGKLIVAGTGIDYYLTSIYEAIKYQRGDALQATGAGIINGAGAALGLVLPDSTTAARILVSTVINTLTSLFSQQFSATGA